MFEASRRSRSKSSVTLEHPLNMPSMVVQSDVSSFDRSIGSDRRTGIYRSLDPRYPGQRPHGFDSCRNTTVAFRIRPCVYG